MASLYHTLLAFLCCGGVYGLSGGFYADNNRAQSVIYKPLARKDKEELQYEILNLLGLRKRPRPRNHETYSSAPRYLMHLYKTLEADPNMLQDTSHRSSNDSRKSFLSDSDVIVSFVNRIHHKAPHLRHEGNRRFWFDVSEVPPEEEIMAAELRIYRDPEFKPEKNPTVYTLGLYAVTDSNGSDEESMLELVDEVLMSSHDTGWILFNVTGPVIYWTAFPEKNHGLYLKIKSPGSPKTYHPHELGIVGPKAGSEGKEPFLVAYFKMESQLHVRKTRAAKKRQHDTYYDAHAWNPYSVQDTYPYRRSCQRWTLYVSFRDLGWSDWIIAPEGYAAFYCHGECSFPLNAHMNATNHAIVQTLVHLMDPSVVPKPCCAPTQLSAITVLYFDDNSNVILKKYKNMVVKSCGCH